MATLKTIKSGMSKSGKIIIAKSSSDKGENVSVWVYSMNYQLGRMVGSWRYIVLNVPMAEADVIFSRRVKAWEKAQA